MRQKGTDTNTEGGPCDSRGRDWRGSATGQGHLGTRSREGQEGHSVRGSGRSVPLGHLGLRPLAPELGEDEFVCVKPPVSSCVTVAPGP